jgi:osmotically-inducible protein OsmY
MNLLLAGAVGAALVYFFDPDNGNRRRKMAVDRVGGFIRRRGREAARAGRSVAAEAHGVKQKARHLKEEEKPQPDDVTLARKVETEIFRDADVPKGKINVNVEDGVVYLRGEIDQPDLIKDLESQARNVQGVLGVENLLHAPGQEAPAKPE